MNYISDKQNIFFRYNHSFLHLIEHKKQSKNLLVDGPVAQLVRAVHS